MDESIEVKIEVKIPEWLRAKMGLTAEVEDDDAEDEYCDRDDASAEDLDAEEDAYDKALHGLAKAMRDGGIADLYFIRSRHGSRKSDRG